MWEGGSRLEVSVPVKWLPVLGHAACTRLIEETQEVTRRYNQAVKPVGLADSVEDKGSGRPQQGRQSDWEVEETGMFGRETVKGWREETT